MFVRVAHEVRRDEKAWELTELNEVSTRPGAGVRRVQRIYVVRGDELAEFKRDLGPASDFSQPEFRIVSMLEDTVAQLLDIAEQQRTENPYFEQRMKEIQGESTLITDWLNWLEERQKVINNQSQFGPAQHKQRIGFHRRTA